MRLILALCAAFSLAGALSAAAEPTAYPAEHYVVDFPGPPAESGETLDRCGGKARDSRRTWTDNANLEVFVVDMSRCGYQANDPAAIDGMAKGIAQAAGKLVSRRAITLMDRPGLEITIAVGTDDRVVGHSRARIFFDGQRAYAVSATAAGDASAVELPDVTAFFESFLILD